MLSKGGFKIVVDPDPNRLTYKRGKRATEEIAAHLKKDKKIFVAGMDRRSAWYYAKRFEALTGRKVKAEQGYYDNESGYEFSLNH
jgi:hypothetical protein